MSHREGGDDVARQLFRLHGKCLFGRHHDGLVSPKCSLTAGFRVKPTEWKRTISQDPSTTYGFKRGEHHSLCIKYFDLLDHDQAAVADGLTEE